ncbi:hypothetical protein HMPREF1318_1989 [Actinomyces massiliensis F0489]|uniref:Uncharacterized protein n=1 Tax=Actinomyces massiliensis F0489 TaxID=1125718 RepID=J0X4S8_9ACTO|nr:hypothetical protein HMPREF1318_1989 [Actinomyces massiliensis F0489]
MGGAPAARLTAAAARVVRSDVETDIVGRDIRVPVNAPGEGAHRHS